MITKKQLNNILSVASVYAGFVSIYNALDDIIYNVLDDIPSGQLPDSIRGDSIRLFHEFEELLSKYNNYMTKTVDSFDLHNED